MTLEIESILFYLIRQQGDFRRADRPTKDSGAGVVLQEGELLDEKVLAREHLSIVIKCMTQV